MKRLLVVALCASAGVLWHGDTSQNVADLPGVEDPREGPRVVLDVERARAARPAAITGNQVAFRLHTYEPFSNADLEHVEGKDYAVAIGISTDSDNAFERLCYVDVRGDSVDQDGFTPFAAVTRGKRFPEAEPNPFSVREEFLGYALVRRPDPDSIEVTIPPSLLALPPSRRFHWQARMISPTEAGAAYYDYVPDARLARGRGGK